MDTYLNVQWAAPQQNHNGKCITSPIKVWDEDIDIPTEFSQVHLQYETFIFASIWLRHTNKYIYYILTSSLLSLSPHCGLSIKTFCLAAKTEENINHNISKPE